jgi:hypothetical protein
MAVFHGYHGTDEYGASLIKRDGFQDSSADSWLGPGIYFFETQSHFDGLEAARWWVKNCKKSQKWVIFEVEIKSTNVLDLFASSEDRDKFSRIKQGFLKKHRESGGKEEDFSLKGVFLFFSRKVEVIRALVDAARLDKFANFIVGYPQIQICVTKSSCIGDLIHEEQGECDGRQVI